MYYHGTIILFRIAVTLQARIVVPWYYVFGCPWLEEARGKTLRINVGSIH